MGVPNYLGNSVIEKLVNNGSTFFRVYNDTGATILKGAIKVASPKFISGIGVVAALGAPATKTTDSNYVGIVVADILDADYGLLQIEGPYGSSKDAFGVATTGSVAANAQLEVLNAGVALNDASAVGGAVLVAEAIAVAIELVTTNVWAVYLIGKQSAIQAT